MIIKKTKNLSQTKETAKLYLLLE